jgi:vitamin B12 transporter
MKSSFLFLYLLLQIQFLLAQEKKDTIPELKIKETKLKDVEGSVQRIDSHLLHQFQFANLQQLLEVYSNIFVKNYGVGAMSTFSIRGSSSAQTQVSWHGVVLNNPATGLSDISTLPVSLFDQIQIEYSNTSNTNNVGGRIVLGHAKPFAKKGVSAAIAAGYESPKNTSLLAKRETTTNKVNNYFAVSGSYANNAFTFMHPNGVQVQTLAHARATQIHAVNNFDFIWNARNTFSMHAWLTYIDRQIPATTFEESSAKEEQIMNHRFLTKWAYQKSTLNMNATLGIFKEKYSYQDSYINVESKIASFTVPCLWNTQWWIRKNHLFSTQVNAQASWLQFNRDANMQRLAMQATYKIENIFSFLECKASLQGEKSNLFRTYVTSSVHLSNKRYKGGKAFMQMARNVRFPTLHEIYFNPGGNKNLLPEVGKNLEMGVNYVAANAKQAFEIDAAFYSRQVDNWIVWFGSSIFTPHNIAKVWSRGNECQLSYIFYVPKQTWKIKHVHTKAIQIGLLSAYTLSTTEESKVLNDYSIGKQIPYVPRYQYKASISWKGAKSECRYIQTYSGYRFITSDESAWLSPFSISSIMFSNHQYFGQNKVEWNLRINNLFNKQYENVVGRVMPRRYVSLGILISKHKHK